MADQGPLPIKLLRFGTPDRFPHAVGSQTYMREAYGLTAEAISQTIQSRLESNTPCVQ
jgi:transketolase C-terminal domain/subunit